MCYIGSHGFLIIGSEHRILLDGAMPSGASSWGYVLPAAETIDKITQAIDPFDQIDIISHAHNDHYSPQVVLGSMTNNQNQIQQIRLG